MDDAQIERYMIRNGGEWEKNGVKYGKGLIYHFKQYWSALWPEDDQTWWTDLVLKEVLENQFISLIGPASSWKTGTVSRIALMDWSVFPECTTVLQSSTDMEGLRSRIYGETTKMWRRASERYEWFPGNPIDHKCVIAHDDIDEDIARDIRDWIIGVPCKTSTGTFLGMGKYSGRKNRRVWCLSDEFQFMQRAVLEAQNNLIANGPNLVPGLIEEGREKGLPKRGYKAIFIGNPNPTVPENPLHLVSEPKEGWASLPDDGKTRVWDSKPVPNSCVRCRTINLNGLDSPNNDYPDEKPRWPHLVNAKRIGMYEKDSESYWTQGVGFVKLGIAAYKVITKELCEQFHAFDQLIWDGSSEIIKVGGLDAAYGGVGGDRCVSGWCEFGRCVDGKTRILIHPPELVPVKILPNITPEDQIASYAKAQMAAAGVPPENFFFDGRGGMGMALARIWSPQVNSIEFGGRPTERPAGPDIYTDDLDTAVRRLKLASEHFSKFVSELWWSSRYAVESDQVRGMTIEIVLDGQPREWRKVAGDKIDVETKKDMKKRTGMSPDLYDWFVICVEGARRRGFIIEKIAAPSYTRTGTSKLEEESEKFLKVLLSRQLKRA